MRLICTGNQGCDLPAAILAQSGNTPRSKFNVTIEQAYVAHAMAMWTYGLGVLVVDDNRRPNWKPIELFTVQDGGMPESWEFSTVSDRGPVLALWGYPTLIHDPNHHNDLVDRHPAAIEAFHRETQAFSSHPSEM